MTAANPAVERWTIRERLAISSRDETAAWLQRANARIRELEDRNRGLEARIQVLLHCDIAELQARIKELEAQVAELEHLLARWRANVPEAMR